ncbi:hypothetical protein H5P28_01170 [Ruficoccus amylovorans]|uniref:Uncharacterized protein n=1 Tax=Ruficoccus amylovorans TaxID=1804625 RepID=A0A842H955_9BACT|nr:hypothetical protein [Ruficoccus amylovorans]MBC2592860.1 hypothetical protein [Ruficoccus amylovorans]
MNPTVIIKNSARDLLDSKLFRQERKTAFAVESITPPSVNITATTGIHFYAKISLRLDLEAADRDAATRSYLQVVDQFARVADALTEESAAELLEVQGEVLHLYLPCEANEQSLLTALAYSVALHEEIEKRVKPLAGDSWKSVRFAFDFGQTILVDTERNIDDSIISLAPAANRPAKEFANDSSTFPNSSVRFPTAILQWSPTILRYAKGRSISHNGQWVSLPIDVAATFIRLFTTAESNLYELQEKLATAIRSKQASINFSQLRINESIDPSSSKISSPTRLRGWSLRADLDGFSRGVEAAFSSPNRDEACRKLTEDFLEVMEDASHFDSLCPWQLVQLAWAGDCASRLVVSQPKDYEADGKERPASIALRWHNKAQNKRWLTSIAGGDTEEGNGRMLVATITVGWRTFRIAGGWPIKRAKQGEQDIGGKPLETVLHSRDVVRLDAHWADAFKPIMGISNFKRASKAALDKAANQADDQAMANTIECHPRMPYIARPRPYYGR